MSATDSNCITIMKMKAVSEGRQAGEAGKENKADTVEQKQWRRSVGGNSDGGGGCGNNDRLGQWCCLWLRLAGGGSGGI